MAPRRVCALTRYQLQLQILGCNCRCLAAVAGVLGCNCRCSAAYSAAIADARLQLQMVNLQLQMFGCNCRCSAAIADTRLQLQMLGCNCRTTQLQLQIPNTLCRLSAQEGIGAKTAQLQLQIANTLCRLSAQAKLQRRPPLQIHRKIGLLSRGVRMYCSHLLDAASVLNCRWLYYTQEDANGMYEIM